ncbi:MAG: DUF1569 domain-containing protein [Planctomycetota bacterium]
MTEPSARRRRLAFQSVDEIWPEVDRLSAGCTTVGKWSFAQICRHLADTLDGSIDGFDLSNHRWKRWFLRCRLLAHALRHGIPEGYTVDPGLTPPPNVALDDSLRRLRRAAQRYARHAGSLKPHPLFGNMPRATWDRVHCVHAAHHLSFVHVSSDSSTLPDPHGLR